MPLPIDFKIDKTITKIKEELLAEFNIDITRETIIAVLNQQVKSTVTGMINGDTIVWKYFGKITATQKRVDTLNKIYIAKGKQPTLIDSGFHRMALDRTGSKIKEGTYIPESKKDLIPISYIENGERKFK